MYNFNLKLCALALFASCNSKIVHELSTFELSEIINGVKYDLVERTTDSKRLVKYYINGNEIGEKEFTDSRIISRVKEQEMQLRKEQDAREREHKFKYDAKLQALKKLISLKLRELREYLIKLEKFNISQYYTYGQETFLNPEDFTGFKDNVSAIESSIDSQEEPELEDLEAMLNNLEDLEKRLHLFYKLAIENAVNKCDDTKLLKELLDII